MKKNYSLNKIEKNVAIETRIITSHAVYMKYMIYHIY